MDAPALRAFGKSAAPEMDFHGNRPLFGLSNLKFEIRNA